MADKAKAQILQLAGLGFAVPVGFAGQALMAVRRRKQFCRFASDLAAPVNEHRSLFHQIAARILEFF